MAKTPATTGSGSVSVAEAATLLGVTPELLVEALVESGLGEAEATHARLLTAELHQYRRRVESANERARERLAELHHLLEAESP